MSLPSSVLSTRVQLNAEELANNLKLRDVHPLLIHGDLDQSERNDVIHKFRRKEADVLVATDVAGELQKGC